MKWQHLPIGSQRKRFKFLFLPFRCNDGYTRWLCYIDVVEEYAGPLYQWEVVSAKPIGDQKEFAIKKLQAAARKASKYLQPDEMARAVTLISQDNGSHSL